MNIKLEQLRVFLQVAETGSISEAARRIGRTAAAISMTLSRLEDEIGGHLFDGDRKSRLTPLGQHALIQARRSVAEHDQALGEIERFARGEQGVCRIAAVPSVSTRLLSGAVKSLAQNNPGIQIHIRDTDSGAIHEALHAGSVDFGIAAWPDNSDLRAEFLLADPFHLVCRRDHPLAVLAQPISADDLGDETLIVNGLCAGIEHAGWQRLFAASNLYMHNTWSILSFVADGIGVTLLPALAQPFSQNLCALPLAHSDLRRNLYIISRAESPLSPVNLRLVDLIREQVEDLDFESA